MIVALRLLLYEEAVQQIYPVPFVMAYGICMYGKELVAFCAQ